MHFLLVESRSLKLKWWGWRGGMVGDVALARHNSSELGSALAFPPV